VNRRFLAPLLLLFGALFFPKTVRADEPVVVAVLVSPSTGEALAARVQAELQSLGFQTTQVSIGDDTNPAALEAAAKKSGAAAAIHVVRSADRAEVWVADRVTGKTLLRTVTCAPGEDAAGVLAVRSVELLRASLLEIETAHPPRGEVRVTETVRRVVAASRPRATPPPFAIGVGFGPVIVPSLSTAFDALVAVVWTPSRLGLEIFGTIPLTSNQVCDNYGCADVTAAMFGGGVRWVLTARAARVQPALGAGFAGVVAHAQGHAVAPYGSARADAGAAVAYAFASLSVALTSHVHIGVDVRAGSALPPIPIRFAGSQVAEWGGPFVATVLRTDIAFP
jgi:hypothetical protein